MSVAANARVFTRPYTGYEDPGLPVGAYIGQAVITGDASAGVSQLNFLFQFGQDALNSQIYSLEHFSAESNASANEELLFQPINMDRLTPQAVLPPTRWSVPLIADGVGSAVARLEALNGLPLWLGSPNTALLECGIRFQVINTAMRVHTYMIQGYIWGPRSVIAPGGPRRPLAGFLGR